MTALELDIAAILLSASSPASAGTVGGMTYSHIPSVGGEHYSRFREFRGWRGCAACSGGGAAVPLVPGVARLCRLPPANGCDPSGVECKMGMGSPIPGV